MASVLLYSGLPHVIKALEGTATQTYDKGDLLKPEAAGRVVVATDGAVFAIALEDAKGVADTVTAIDLISADNIYVMNAAAGTTTDQTNVYEKADVTFTIGAHTLAAATSTGSEAIIVGLHPEDGAKAGGRYLCRFLASVIYETGL